MAKKCIICNEGAVFRVKDGNEFYCEECAEEHFADLSLLQKVEGEAQALKKVVLGNINGNLQDDTNRED